MASLFSIEPKLKKILDQEVIELRNDLSKIDEIFEGADQQDIDDIKSWLAKNEIKVILGYPHDATQLPCISITLGSFNNSGTVWGDVFSKQIDSASLNSKSETPKRGELQTNIYRFSVWSELPQLTLSIFYILHYILINTKGLLVSVGIRESIMGGGDLEPAPQYFPTFVYLRVLTLTALAETVGPVFGSGVIKRKFSSMSILE